MSDINPFEQGPLWEDNQVVTTDDMIRIKSGLLKARHRFANANDIENTISTEVMLDFVDVLLDWVLSGKPEHMRLKGEEVNEDEQ